MCMMEVNTITIEDMGGGLKLLRLNRPSKKNALSIEMRREITEALAEMATAGFTVTADNAAAVEKIKV